LAVVSVLAVQVRRVTGVVRVLLVTAVRVRLVVVRVTGRTEVVGRGRGDIRDGCDVRDDGGDQRFDHGGGLCDDRHGGGGAADRLPDDFGGESVDGVGLVFDGAQVTVRVHGAVVTGHVVAVPRFLLVLLVTGGRIVDRVAEVVLGGSRRLVNHRGARQADENRAQQTQSLKGTSKRR